MALGSRYGVTSIEKLKDRCVLDGDCWIYRAGDRLWFPPLQKVVNISTAIGYLRTGEKPPKGTYWYCTCTTPKCANPDHRKPGSRSEQMLAARLSRGPDVRAKIIATKRAQSHLTADARKDIRTSDESLLELSRRHGISMTTASRIRRGEGDLRLMSVFTWRGE